MVKRVILFLLLAGIELAASPLLHKIESLIGHATYVQNESFIRVIFKNSSDFHTEGRIDTVAVVERLRENGLLKLLLKRPSKVELTFSTNGSPLFFVTLMGEALYAMGYNHFLTESMVLHNDGFQWRVSMLSEYATDPTVLQRELRKRGCGILDIARESDTRWHYTIDMSRARLKQAPLRPGETREFKRMLYPRWLEVADVSTLTLWSLKGNSWYPYIAFYDNALRLLKVYRRDKESWQIVVNLPRSTAYVKIADMYSRKNMKEGLRVEAGSQR